MTAVAALTLASRATLAGPTGGAVVAGSASIAQSGSTTNINQSTNQAVINWQGFSIAPSETVKFNQPSSTSATLNRVLGNEQSVISGALNANGQVFIVNAAGVLFTKGAQVNVGGLVASTLDISNQNFMAGNYSFSGSSPAAVVNQGRIHAGGGGYVALLGKTVSNDGVIVAKLGTVVMASGDKITLNFAGNSLLDVTIDKGTLNALVQNRRAIIADGGRVILSAKAADQVLSAQVNNSGLIQARTMASLKGGAGTRVAQKGSIKLLAQGGTVNVSGKLDASAPKGGDGGAIETSGSKVRVADNAVITTKAASGQNGTWLIDPDGFTIAAAGGDITGTKLSSEFGSNNVTILSTQGSGTGGNIDVNDTVTWRSGTTLTLNATDAINVNAIISGANGGLVLNAGTDINVNAPSSLAVAALTATAAGDVNLNAGQTFTGGGTWTFNGSNINVDDTVNWSAGTLTLNAGASGGFINLNAVMTASGTASLVATYNTGMDTSTIVVAGLVTPSSTYGTPLGGINPLFDPKSGTFLGRIDFTNSVAANPLTINGQAYTLITSMKQLDMLDGFDSVAGTGTATIVTGHYALASNLDAGGRVDAFGNVSGTVYTSAPIANFTGTLEGLGHTISNLVIAPVPVFDPVHGIMTVSGNLGLIGNLGLSQSTGTGTATVRDIGVVNILIKDTLPGFVGGGSTDGALVAANFNGTIVNAFATGNPNAPVPPGSPFDGVSNPKVTAAIAGTGVGGLVGLNEGIIVDSHADVSVYSSSGNAGGLVGNARGGTNVAGTFISVMLNDYATGTVSSGLPAISTGGFVGSANIGGFVGLDQGAVISNSYSTGQVWTLNSINVGGFAGQNTTAGRTAIGVLNNDASSGNVNIGWTATAANGQDGGGFVGSNGGVINNSATSSNVTLNVPGPAGFFNVGNFSGQQAPRLAGTGITNNPSTTTGTPPLISGGQTRALAAVQQANNARSQAQTLTQQATAQQIAVAQQQAAAAARLAAAQRGASAANVASTSTSIAAASPPNGTVAAAGTSAATSPAAAAINANVKAIEANVEADDQRLRRRQTAAATTTPRRSGGGLGATIRSIEINGKHLEVPESTKNRTPGGSPQ